MRVIGLTGSIGMGKSTTARFFRQLGVPVHDADAVVHRLYAGEAVPAIEAEFPGVSVDGVIDRARLGARVVGDHAAMKRLEAIVHPLVAQAREAFLRAARLGGHRLAVLDIPLLLEGRGADGVDVVVVVSAPEAMQRSRVLARPGMSSEKFEALLSRQMPDTDKRRHAHVVIDTGRGLEAAQRQVRDLVAMLS